MDASYEVGEKVELVTPARFLFDAGSTPKAWNRKMLNDPHLKVAMYESDASKLFANTDIKGGSQLRITMEAGISAPSRFSRISTSLEQLKRRYSRLARLR